MPCSTHANHKSRSSGDKQEASGLIYMEQLTQLASC